MERTAREAVDAAEKVAVAARRESREFEGVTTRKGALADLEKREVCRGGGCHLSQRVPVFLRT